MGAWEMVDQPVAHNQVVRVLQQHGRGHSLLGEERILKLLNSAAQQGRRKNSILN